MLTPVSCDTALMDSGAPPMLYASLIFTNWPSDVRYGVSRGTVTMVICLLEASTRIRIITSERWLSPDSAALSEVPDPSRESEPKTST